MYHNVCISNEYHNTGRRKYYYLRNDAPEPREIPYTAYFTGRELRSDVEYVRAAVPTDGRFIRGRTLWLHDYYPNHLGHFAELAVKLPADRGLFPGRIHQIVWHPEATEFNLQILRLAFEAERFQLPLLYRGEWLNRDDRGLYCLEELMYVRFTTEYFRSFDEASEWRRLGLARCDVSTVEWPDGDDEFGARQARGTSLSVLFYQRTFKKKVLNMPQLSLMAEMLGFKAETVDEDPTNDLCRGITTVQDRQIIVTSHGTSQFFSVFAAPFTVVISIVPPNFLHAGWKTFQFYASIRSVEFVTVHKRYGHFLANNHAGQRLELTHHHASFAECLMSVSCTFYWENNHDVRVHPARFGHYLIHAASLWNRPDYHECEFPLSQRPVIFWEFNYQVCEPPTHCNCCNEECQQAVAIRNHMGFP